MWKTGNLNWSTMPCNRVEGHSIEGHILQLKNTITLQEWIDFSSYELICYIICTNNNISCSHEEGPACTHTYMFDLSTRYCISFLSSFIRREETLYIQLLTETENILVIIFQPLQSIKDSCINHFSSRPQVTENCRRPSMNLVPSSHTNIAVSPEWASRKVAFVDIGDTGGHLLTGKQSKQRSLCE